MRWLSTLLLALTSAVFAQQPQFQSFDISPAPLIEWDQTPNTFYTGQTMNVSWTAQNFAATDQARITYPGVGGTRTLTSGVLINATTFKVRLSDASNMVATNIQATLALTTNTSVSILSQPPFSVIQSKVQNIVALDGNRTLGGGQNAVCDDRTLTLTWRGLGQAQFGNASITLSKIAGSPGTLGTAIANFPVQGNTTVSFFCPRASVPSTFSAYAFQISVQEPGGTAYTGTSASFNVAAAPTPSPTSSTTPTPSKTPTPSFTPTPTGTPSISETRTPSQTPTPTGTPTPSLTPSPSMTPSTTETARPSIDYVAIGRAAASQVDTQTPAIAGALGGIGGVLVLLGAVKWYQNKAMTERRKKKLAMTARIVQQTHAMYGMSPEQDAELAAAATPSVVMYTVQNMPQRSPSSRQLASYKKGFAPKPAGS